MELLGVAVLLSTWICCGYLLFSTAKATGRITVFGSLGTFCGLALLLAPRLTEVEVPLFGSIRAAAQRAEIATSEIEALVGDAQKRVAELERLAIEAKTQISQLKANEDFSSLLISARNGNRDAFKKIQEISSGKGPLHDVAAGATGLNRPRCCLQPSFLRDSALEGPPT